MKSPLALGLATFAALVTLLTGRSDARLLRLDDRTCCFDRDQSRAALDRARDEADLWRQ